MAGVKDPRRQIDVVELMDSLIPGCDTDLVRPLQKRIKARYHEIMLGTKVTDIQAQKSGLKVSFEGKQAPEKPQVYDKVLVAVGRRPNGLKIGADKAGVKVEESGFILVDAQIPMRLLEFIRQYIDSPLQFLLLLNLFLLVVGAMMAASTGIVGATVVTMGLLSLPTMLRGCLISCNAMACAARIAFTRNRLGPRLVVTGP